MLRASIIMSIAWFALVFRASAFDLVVVNEFELLSSAKPLHRACKHEELER